MKTVKGRAYKYNGGHGIAIDSRTARARRMKVGESDTALRTDTGAIVVVANQDLGLLLPDMVALAEEVCRD